jgi:hypothetical protein
MTDLLVKRPSNSAGSLRLVAAALALLAACGGASKSGLALGQSSVATEEPVRFAYDSLDARPVNSEQSKGKPLVLAFVTTWDLQSQAQVAFLLAMTKGEAALESGTSYAVVALDEAKNRELVVAYAKALQIPFPTAIADAETVAGRGNFGELAVPTVVVLDNASRVAFRKLGLSKPDELRAVLRALASRGRKNESVASPK